jgi:hypothetical protein
VGVTLALLAGCSDDGGASGAATRPAGSTVSQQEAQVLARLLHEDRLAGGADFTETAPFAEGALITLTGTVDWTRPAGHARAVTTYRSGQPGETRDVYFTADRIWFGGVPGLADALTGAGLPQATYIARPLAVTRSDGSPNLTDVLVQLVLNLSADKADDPRSFRAGGYTWRGQRAIDGRLAAVYGLAGGATVAVAASDQRLLQFVTPLPGQDFQVTITLPQHGRRTVQLPTGAQTVDAAQHQDVAAAVGV